MSIAGILRRWRRRAVCEYIVARDVSVAMWRFHRGGLYPFRDCSTTLLLPFVTNYVGFPEYVEPAKAELTMRHLRRAWRNGWTEPEECTWEL